MAPGVFARSRATGFSSGERERSSVCVCGGEGGAPLQFKPHYGTLYKTRRDNVQHCANVDSLTYVSRALVASVFRIVERVGSL